MFQGRYGLLSASTFADSSMYAHFLFEAFDTNKNGSVSFEVSFFFFFFVCQLHFYTWKETQTLKWAMRTCCPPQHKDAVKISHSAIVSFFIQDFVFGLSIILRGTINDRLNWAFNLYDLNKDGCVTKEVYVRANTSTRVMLLLGYVWLNEHVYTYINQTNLN